MEYLLKKIANLNHVGIADCKNGGQPEIYYEENAEYNPLSYSESLKDILINGCMKQEAPYLYKDQFEVYYSCIRTGDGFIIIGPMSMNVLDQVETHQYYRFYGIQTEMEKRLMHFTLAEILDIVEIAANIVLDKEYTDDELIYANNLAEGAGEQKEKQVRSDVRKGEEEFYHHTYQEERKLLDSVREGRCEEALRYSRNMDSRIGKMADKEINQWKNLAIAAIALCTRASIEGGTSPAAAYRLSDFYVQKCDGCKDIAQMIKYRDHAVKDLTEQVRRRQSRKSSSYIERAKDYIAGNYKKKIYLSDMAENLGLSETYLSRLFKKETGIRIQDFIVDVRLEHAANLLKYSDETLSNVAEYVNFPSQSYMGKVFKEKYGVTPKYYRKLNQPSEFIEKE